jgi:metallophosphoesterase (TIGR00282 family)
MRLLFLGDIVGRPGRRALAARLDGLRRELALDVIVANGENASGGLGLTGKNARELHEAGVDVLTSGNHIWKMKDVHALLDGEPWLLRPANYPPGAPGRGAAVYDIGPGLPCVAVINLIGRTYMDAVDCPFRAAQESLRNLPEKAVVLVDFHAEATSEKRAMAFMLQGRVSAVIGTHTHVQTNDARILPGGTGFLTDAGMCGPMDSVLGMDQQIILNRFLTGLPVKFELASGPVMLNGAVLEIDAAGRCTGISVWREECPTA